MICTQIRLYGKDDTNDTSTMKPIYDVIYIFSATWKHVIMINYIRLLTN